MVFRYRLNPMMGHLREEMDRLLGGLLAEPFDGGPTRGQPAVNVWQQDDAVMVELEVPGVHNEQIDISVVGNELSVKVERPDVAEEGVVYHRRERPAGSFTRVLRLPVEVDAEHVEADLSDGVLTITLPKAASAKPRKIAVASA